VLCIASLIKGNASANFIVLSVCFSVCVLYSLLGSVSTNKFTDPFKSCSDRHPLELTLFELWLLPVYTDHHMSTRSELELISNTDDLYDPACGHLSYGDHCVGSCFASVCVIIQPNGSQVNPRYFNCWKVRLRRSSFKGCANMRR
jgi:hypothetical protein